MRGNTFGKMISMTSFGESHGPGIGVVIDGVPAGLDFNPLKLQEELERRAPGRLKGTTARKEADQFEILSGIFEGKTLGTPIAVFVKNTNQRSGDYDKLKDQYRPGHADRTTMMKYGIRDHRGGGRSSGRETISRVIGGYFASLILPIVNIRAAITKLGPFESHEFDIPKDFKSNAYSFLTPNKDEEIERYLLDLKQSGDSVGGRVLIQVDECPIGLGEPAFDKLKADLSKALLSIGAVVSFSYGIGHRFAELSGKEVSAMENAFGGIEGGISNGAPMKMEIIFKPTSTVGDKAKEGRHDPCIIPRAIPVVENMVRFVLADHFLRQNAYQVGNHESH